MSAPRSTKPRRADAERSIARIREAAVDALASDPDASMGEIARRAGVVRATIYVHFPTREDLIAAVTDHAIDEVTEALRTAEPARGEAPEALRRVVAAAWQALGRFHSLVAINTQVPSKELRSRHEPVLALLKPLIERGQRDGSFRADVPAEWHLSMILALIHAASAELQVARLTPEELEGALAASVIGAVS